MVDEVDQGGFMMVLDLSGSIRPAFWFIDVLGQIATPLRDLRNWPDNRC
jgi:hypothetical protein